VKLLIFSEALFIAIPDLLTATFDCQRFMSIAVFAFSVAKDLNWLIIERELLLLFAINFNDNLVL